MIKRITILFLFLFIFVSIINANTTVIKELQFINNGRGYISLLGDGIFDLLLSLAFDENEDLSELEQWKPKKNDDIVRLVTQQLNEYNYELGDVFAGAYLVDNKKVAVIVIILNSGPSIRYYYVPNNFFD